MKKVLTILGVIIVLLFTACLASCEVSDLAYKKKQEEESQKQEEKDALSEYEELLESISTDATEPPPEPFAERVYVVISETCSGELSAKAGELSSAISEKTGISAMVKYDNEEIKEYKGDLYILLGNTDSTISKEAIKPLRYGDYVCRWDRDLIVLGGRHDEATVSAVDEFISTVLHGASYTSLMSEDAHFENITEYDVSSVTLNGYDLYDFTLVYGTDGVEREIAETLRRYIVQKSGYHMNMMPSSSVNGTVGKTVTVSLATDGRAAAVVLDGLNVSVYGGDKYGLSVAAASFIDMLFESIDDGRARAEIGDGYVTVCENRELKICSAYIGTLSSPPIEYIEDMAELMRGGGYDIIIFDKAETKQIRYICENKPSDEYSYDVSVGGYTVIYKTDVFDSVSCEGSTSGYALAVTVKVKGEKETRRIVRIFSYDKNEPLLSGGETYDVTVSDEAVPNNDGVGLVGSEVWSFDGKEYGRYILTEKYLNVTEPTAVSASGDKYFEMFLSFSTSVDICAEYAKLKEAVD